MRLKRWAVAASCLGLSLGAPGVLVASNLVTNGDFESYTGSSPKNAFASVQPTGWSGGGGLTFLDAPGTADNGTYLSVYTPFPMTSPTGGNFVEADGDYRYSGAFSQTINGLTPGQAYTLSFYQAAGQQQGFTGATYEQWKVDFGTSTQSSTLMNNPSGGVQPWNLQTMVFTADAASDVLTFLAIGGPTTTSLPPIVFLDGVSMVPAVSAVPEPATIGLAGLGLVGAGLMSLRRRARAKAALAQA